MVQVIDITGSRFGRLTAIEKAGSGRGRALWACLCDCGGHKIVDGVRLRNGAVKSCGCWKTDMPAQLRHGQNRTGNRSKAYSSWHHMRDRCLNPASAKWEHYGGRGITICDRWATFEAFYEDMGDCPPGHTIDRIDVNGNYEPGNCRWADALAQSRNVRRNVKLSMGGETLPVWEWSERVGISVTTLIMRRRRGWSDSEALTTPMGQRRSM